MLHLCLLPDSLLFFFFNDTATTEIYPLSLHDALPISPVVAMSRQAGRIGAVNLHERLAVQNDKDELGHLARSLDRKSTRLNSSHSQISYAVFCLKKKKQTHK